MRERIARSGVRCCEGRWCPLDETQRRGVVRNDDTQSPSERTLTPPTTHPGVAVFVYVLVPYRHSDLL